MTQQPISRRRFQTAALLAAASLTAPAVRAQTRPGRRQVSIAVGARSSFCHLPLTLAEQLGYFRAEGLEVQVLELAAGTRAQQAALEGLADVVGGPYEHTISLQNQGQFFQAFVLQGRAPQIALGVSTRTLPDFKSVADLRGRRIGIAAPGSSTGTMASLVLARAGLRAGDVSFVGVGTSVGALAALRSGQIDALSSMDPVMTLLEQKGDVRIISDARTLKGARAVFGGPMPASCLYAPLEFVQKHPDTVQALSNAIVHALKWLQTAGPGDLLRTVPEAHLLGDRGLYLASFEKVREAIAVDGVFPEDGALTALRTLAGLDPGLRAERIDLAKTWTNQFATRAKARFKA